MRARGCGKGGEELGEKRSETVAFVEGGGGGRMAVYGDRSSAWVAMLRRMPFHVTRFHVVGFHVISFRVLRLHTPIPPPLSSTMNLGCFFFFFSHLFCRRALGGRQGSGGRRVPSHRIHSFYASLLTLHSHGERERREGTAWTRRVEKSKGKWWHGHLVAQPGQVRSRLRRRRLCVGFGLLLGFRICFRLTHLLDRTPRCAEEGTPPPSSPLPCLLFCP